MLCLRCRAAYDLRESDFRKLVTLSQTGRSTATTVVATTAVTGLPQFGVRETGEPPRLLSFTDNRQDASLQAGHTNDFVQVVQLRAALVKALRSTQGNTLAFDALGEAIFAALDPKPEHFMKEPVDAGPGFASARNVMMQVLHYLAVEDLARAWRVAQPNLEQVCARPCREVAGGRPADTPLAGAALRSFCQLVRVFASITVIPPEPAGPARPRGTMA